MILDLDDPAAVDRGRTGAKATTLAQARRIGLPVLPGFVVEASASSRHMQIGANALPLRGSGGARLAVTAEPPPGADDIVSAGGELANALVARSSSPLEGGGEWAGAFSSYVGISPEELPKAVVGCWASTFSVDALARQGALGVEPGSFGMAVLVQPAIAPVAGGVAELDPEGTVVVEAVAGSPVSLLQGWARGVAAQRTAGEEWQGEEAIHLVGEEVLDELGSALEVAANRFGVNRCEWGVTDQLWLLQLSEVNRRAPTVTTARRPTPGELLPLVRALMTAPGVLGAELVLPWALAGLPWPQATRRVGEGDLVARAVEMSERLTSRVWRRPAAEALTAARAVLDRLRGPDPGSEIDTIRNLDPPDRYEAEVLFSIISEMGTRLAAQGRVADLRSVWHLSVADLTAALAGDPVPAPRRVGVGPWEPFVAGVVLDHGTVSQGTPAAAGIGAGLRHRVVDAEGWRPPHRAVVTASHPVPKLSQLIWDAAGLVTGSGSPAAHVFESARTLGVPAVCGAHVSGDDDLIVAVDGESGLVATLPLAPSAEAVGR